MNKTSAERAPPSFRGSAAHVARKLDQRFFAVIDVHDLAAAIEPEAHSGFFLAHAIEDEGVVGNHLDRWVDLLDLDHGWHRPSARREEVMDVDDIFTRHDAANADGFLTERA